MEQLNNEFTVNRSIEHTWQVLTDLERIAPCMPGAQLQEVEGEIYRGVVKVKLGPIATAFKGQATFVDRNDASYTATLKGEGRDTGGKGNADALITATLEAVSAHSTKVTVSTDLRVTGKVAQFGRGVMGDVSEKLMAQFAANLNTMLDSEPDTPAETRWVVDEMVRQVLARDPLLAQLEVAPWPEPAAAAWLRAPDAAQFSRRVAEFDAELGERTSVLVDAFGDNQRRVADAVREVLGLCRADLDDASAIARALDAAEHPQLGDTLNTTTHSKLGRCLHAAHYAFKKKLSHAASPMASTSRTAT